MRVRVVARSEWRRLREIRLRALTESPSAFGARLEDESQRPLEEWKGWPAGGAAFVAEDGDEWRGVVAVVPDRTDPAGFFVLSMWVDPELRDRGLGRLLLDAAVAHAARQGASSVRLGVVDGNGAAARLYERAGFEPTGGAEPLRSDPSRTVVSLRLALPGHYSQGQNPRATPDPCAPGACSRASSRVAAGLPPAPRSCGGSGAGA